MKFTLGRLGLALVACCLPSTLSWGYWSPHLEWRDYTDRPPYLVPPGTTLISRFVPVTASSDPRYGGLEQIVDGDKHYPRDNRVELDKGPQWVQIDLCGAFTVYAVLIWHFLEGQQIYFGVIVEASNDPDFKEGVVTLFNNDHQSTHGRGYDGDCEYVEAHEGKLIQSEAGADARHIRLYSNGNVWDEYNHYVEVEVFGKPAYEESGSMECIPLEIALPEEEFFGGPPL